MFCLCKDPLVDQRRFPRTIAQKSILSVCFSSTSQLLACTTRSALMIWDVPRQVLLQEFKYTDNNGDMQCLVVAHGNSMVIGGGQRGISVFDLTTKVVRFHAKPAECLSLDVAETSQVGVFGLLNGAMQIFAQNDPGVVLRTIRAQGPVCSVCLNENGSVLVSCSNTKCFQVWNVSNGVLLHTVPHKSWVWASVCDATGTRFVSCEGNHACTLHMWSNATSSVTLLPRDGNSQFESYAVSHDFTRLLFACNRDNLLILLHIDSQAWSEVAQFPVPIKDVSFARNNSLCAVGLTNGQMWILDLSQKDKQRLAILFHSTQDILPVEIFKLVKQMLCWNNKI